MSQDEQGYNGWKNYETWCMALWIDNDQGSYEESRDLARTALQEHEDRTGYGATAEGSLAHALKEWQDELRPEEITGTASVWTDLLTSAFQSIDWYEIAANYLEEVTENA